MRKRILLSLALIALGAGGIGAQVLIGAAANETFHEAAMLELRAHGDRGGLLMPQVALTSATVWAPVAGNACNGMSVYNTHPTTQNGLAGKGVYVWTDGRWYLSTSSAPCSSSPSQAVLAVNGLDANNKIAAFKPFLAYVGNPEAGTSYVWDLPAGLIGHSASSVITIIGSQAGDYTIKVRARNECGESSDATYLLTINPFFDLPQIEDGSGNVAIQGVSCYDIAQTGSADCGSLSSRRAAFATESQRTRTYTLSIQDNTHLSNLRVGSTDDAKGIIQSVSGNVAGTLYANEYPITVVFADDINNIVKNQGKSTAKLCAVFQEGTGANAVDKYVTLTITVQDCSCCPLNVAKVIEDAAYEGADVIALGADVDATLAHFVRIPGAALCVWKENQGNPASGTSGTIGNKWVDANIKCTQTMAADGYGDDWRLPNVAEMYYKLHPEFYADGGRQSSSTSAGISRFLSNTVVEGNRGAIYMTKATINSYNVVTYSIDGGSIAKTTNSTANFRCVKTINY